MKRFIFILLLSTSLSFCVNAQVLKEIDEVAPFKDGLAGVKKEDSWGFIDSSGELVIDFREDIVESTKNPPTFSNGLCLIKEVKDGITYYGYIDTKGEKVIPAEYLMATPFENGYARVIKLYKEVTSSSNVLGKRIVYYSYNEVLINTKNHTVRVLRGPYNLVLNEYELLKNPPKITSKFISDNLIVVRDEDNRYMIYNLDK